MADNQSFILWHITQRHFANNPQSVKNFETFLKIRQELKTSSGYYYRRPM